MTNKEKEKVYDEEIAPALLKVSQRCQELGMAFIASVEFDPPNGGRGRTEFQPKDTVETLSAAQRLIHWAAICDGNIDRLFIACDRHGREHGHSSVYLSQLGNKNIKYDGTEFAAFTIVTPK